MPALAPVPGVARVAVQGLVSARPCVNVFHVKYAAGGPISSADLTSMLTSFKTLWEAKFSAILSNQYGAGTIVALDLTNDVGASASVAFAATGIGTGLNVPASTSACVTWKIARHYRGGHPRTYLGALPTSAIFSPTSLESSFVTTLNTNANAFLTGVNAISAGGSACSLVCVHRYKGKDDATGKPVPLAVPIASPIVSAQVDSRIDSQRRRLGPDR